MFFSFCYNKIMKTSSKQHFLQSDFWSEILRREGKKIINFSSSDLAMAVFKNLPGSYTYCYLARGPIFFGNEEKRSSGVSAFLKESTSLSKTEKLVFVRIEPSFEDFLLIKEFAKSEKIKLQKTIDLQPQKTLIINLSKELGQLEKELSQKTRYNIRLAEKKGVVIVKGSHREFSDFWRLMQMTGERDSFGIHNEAHYRNLIENGGDNLELWFAKFENQIIAAGIFCFFGDQATYLHGASDHNWRSLMAPQLLQWKIIQEAKQRGFLVYDFYGIDEKKWPGVTRFKKGFGGEIIEYPGTYDLVLRPSYYYFYQNLRLLYRKIRKLL